MPVHYHVVFTLPAPIADIALHNKAVIYGLLFDIAAETLLTIAADPKHLGAAIGATLVLHTWGSAMTHHPHVHGIVPGGGLTPDGQQWLRCRRGFLVSVRVLSRLFRRRFLEQLQRLHGGNRLQFFGAQARLADARTFKAWLAPLRTCEWVVYAKRPFAGPKAVLAYLSRYTHRVAISNSRLLAMDDRGVRFRWKDYRAHGHARNKAMTLSPQEFMRRFLLHVLPARFHRIRHYGLLARRHGSDAKRPPYTQEHIVIPVAHPLNYGVVSPHRDELTVCRDRWKGRSAIYGAVWARLSLARHRGGRHGAGDGGCLDGRELPRRGYRARRHLQACSLAHEEWGSADPAPARHASTPCTPVLQSVPRGWWQR